MVMKGVILAGGHGTRLLPATRIMNKHLVPILHRPMILYPLSVLTDVFGIRDILLVTGGEHLGDFANFLGDGSEYGVSLTYRVQREANGIAGALRLARDFVGQQRFAAILGDQVFDKWSVRQPATGQCAAYFKDVPHPERFGVAQLDAHGDVVQIVEKPRRPPSRLAQTGLYVYSAEVWDHLDRLRPSKRGELEITDLNNALLGLGLLEAVLHTGFWTDAGTPESLATATAWAAAVDESYWAPRTLEVA